MLRIQQLVAGYGSITALKNVDIAVPKGSIVSLIGANGAGKTTTMKTIMGLIKPQAGQIEFQGENVTARAVHKIVNKAFRLFPKGAVSYRK